MSARKGRWPRGIGLDKRQARRHRRQIAANLRVPERAAFDCVIAGCRFGTPGLGPCECVLPPERQGGQ